MKKRNKESVSKIGNPKPKKAKKPTLASLKKKLQIEFNRYARLYYYFIKHQKTCYTCNKPLDFGKTQCGHYYTVKGHGSVRFDIMNVNIQCFGCNHMKSGNLIEYTHHLEQEHGKEFLDQLRIKAKSLHKFTAGELESMIKKYRKLKQDLEKQYL